MISFLGISGWLRYEGSFALPYLFMLGLLILNIVALPVPVLSGVKVPFAFMAIYYWAMYRPAILPSWLLFVSGLVFDIVSGLPLGINALSYVLLGWLITRRRRFLLSQPFPVIWFFFGIFSAAMLALQWAVFCILHWTVINPVLITSSWALGCFLFPAVSIMLRLTHKILPLQRVTGP